MNDTVGPEFEWIDDSALSRTDLLMRFFALPVQWTSGPTTSSWTDGADWDAPALRMQLGHDCS